MAKETLQCLFSRNVVSGQRLLQDERHMVDVVNESGAHALVINKTLCSDSGVLACVAHNRSGEAAFQVLLACGQGNLDSSN